MSDKPKVRMILDVPEEIANNIDARKDKLGFKTRTALVRHALSVLFMMDDKLSDGYTMQFKRGDEIVEVVLLNLDKVS